MIQPRYRADYQGEYIILGTSFRNGHKRQTREYVKNVITNQHISHRGAVIGVNENLQINVAKALLNHPGGLLGKKKLQTYGCNDAWRIGPWNFYAETDPDVLNEIKQQRYHEKTIVFTKNRHCLANPGDFYIIPYYQRLAPAATAAYLAAFDGHLEVFLLGIDGTNSDGSVDQACVRDLEQVIKCYTDVMFRFVTNGQRPPDQWLNHPNTELWKYRQFITHCDV